VGLEENAVTYARAGTHISCLRCILGVRSSNWHSNTHIRSVCGIVHLAAIITTNRLLAVAGVCGLHGICQATACSSVLIFIWGANNKRCCPPPLGGRRVCSMIWEW